jgi:hypothetical protein
MVAHARATRNGPAEANPRCRLRTIFSKTWRRIIKKNEDAEVSFATGKKIKHRGKREERLADFHEK